MAVVMAPPNGSRTMSHLRLPARMHGSINFGGKVAKCAPLNGFVGTVQTVRRLRRSTVRVMAALYDALYFMPLPALEILFGRMPFLAAVGNVFRSEEHTSELQSLR